jgi:tetratricopeptide (TPR) repeat protein
MIDDRWRRIERLFEAALALPADARAGFLAAECPDDELRARLASLLAAHEAIETGAGASTDFLDTLDPKRAAALLHASAPEQDERATIGRYRLIRRVGRGGMGVVYLGRDPALDRPVALKLLPPDLSHDETANRRFFHEARAASALDHVNVATVYEVGETEDQRPFIAMAYYQGDTLRQRIERGPAPVVDAVDHARQVAQGLAAAHDAGIIHRDIKPENLIVTPDGVVKIVDFGVAKAAEATVTRAGGALGTVAYMSPEQTRGEPLDARSDLWSLGVVLYEMLAGDRPFRGDGNDAVLYAIRHDAPTPLASLRPDAPAALVRVVARCLEKDPARRFRSARELAEALDVLSHPEPPRGPTARLAALVTGGRRETAVAMALVLALVATVVVAGAGGYTVLRALGMAPPGLAARGVITDRDPVLLADFTTDAADARIARVITEALRIDLLQSPSLRMAESGEVAAALRRMGGEPGAELTAPVALELAQREGLKAVITGEVRAVGDGYLLTARIVSAADGATLTAVRESARGSADLIDAVDRLSKGVRRGTGESLRDLRAADPLPRVATASLPALRLYAEGRALAAAGGDQARVAALLEGAVAMDSMFAVAHRALAITYWNVRADRARTVAATSRAYQLRDRLPEADRLIIEAIYYWHVLGDTRRTAEAYRRVLALDPGNMVAINNLALTLLFDGRPEEAEDILRAGIAGRSPSQVPALLFTTLAEALYFQRRSEAALAVLDSATADAGQVPLWELARIRILGGDGRLDDAEAVAHGLLARHGDSPQRRSEALRGLWHLALVQGRLTDAEGHFRELEAILDEGRFLDALARALIQRADAWRSLTGDPTRALADLHALLDRADLDVLTVGASVAPRAGAALAAAGDTARARRLADAWDALPAEARGDPDAFTTAPARAWIDLAAGRPHEAVRRLAQAASGTIQAINYLPDLARAHQQAGQPDSAIAVLERYLDFRHTRRVHRVPGHLGPSLLSLAELYEETGNTEGALVAYGRLVDLWADADAVLQLHVEHARRRIASLTSESTS